MRCRICGTRAVIRLRAHNIALCKICLQEFVRRRVKRAIKQYRLLYPDERPLVAVSGGKDSLAIWDIFTEIGYRPQGLYIDLGIEGYSDRSEEAARRFAEDRDLELRVERVRDHFFGLGIPELASLDHRPPCSICGMVKRYLMNKAAYEGGYVLVTGHNLDDEGATLLGNVLDWKEGYLQRQAPRLPAGKGLAPRAKPLVLCTERETAAYAISRGIDYILEECPFSHGATSLFYKGLLSQLEERSPGSKLRFYQGFLRIRKRFQKEEPSLKPCSYCGFPTTTEVCNFCRLKERARKEKSLVVK